MSKVLCKGTQVHIIKSSKKLDDDYFSCSLLNFEVADGKIMLHHQINAAKLKIKLPAGPEPKLSFEISISNFLSGMQISHKLYNDESKDNNLVMTSSMSPASQQSWFNKFSSADTTVLILQTNEYRVAQQEPSDGHIVASVK